MNERDRTEVIKVDLSQLNDEDFIALVGGEDYEHVRPLQEVDGEFADTIVTIAEIVRSGGVRGTPREMTEELTLETTQGALDVLNEKLSVLNIPERL